jgi:hypothetical protein
MFLPNGTHIYFANPSLETFERIDGMIERREPITVTVRNIDGTEYEHVLWHPENPVIPLEDLMPKGYGASDHGPLRTTSPLILRLRLLFQPFCLMPRNFSRMRLLLAICGRSISAVCRRWHLM